jgi:hypothetical protein
MSWRMTLEASDGTVCPVDRVAKNRPVFGQKSTVDDLASTECLEPILMLFAVHAKILT